MESNKCESCPMRSIFFITPPKRENLGDSRNNKKLSQYGMATSYNFSLRVKSACLGNLTSNSGSSVARQHPAYSVLILTVNPPWMALWPLRRRTRLSKFF